MTNAKARASQLVVWFAGPAVPVATSAASLLVARNVSPDLYGRVAYFFSNFYLIVLLWNLGLPAQATREVAWSVGMGGIAEAARTTSPYLIARVISVTPLILLCCASVLAGDTTLASAALAGGVASLTTFSLALVQGLRRATVAAAIQIGQALLYLAMVAAWAKSEPERVFVGVIASYAVSLLLATLAARSVVPGPSTWWSLSHGKWKMVTRSLGWMYGVLLLSAPYSSLAVLVLGHASRFEDAAAFSIALTIPLILVVSSGTVIALQYYPQLSQMLADPRSDTRSHFDSLYRVLAWAGLSVCSMLCFYPQTIISVLFTARYSAAVEPMISLASAAAVVPIGQFALWTLLARGQRGWPVLGLLAQLVALLPFIGAALIWPELPLWVLGLGHTLAAGVALATWIMGLRQQRVQCSWRPRRVAVAAVVALASAAALRVGSPDGLNGGVNGVVLLASTGLVVAGVTAIVIWSDELIPRLHRRWPALLRGSASSSAARAPAATRCLREVPLARTSSDPTENATPTVSTR